jgi:hypothetical protein
MTTVEERKFQRLPKWTQDTIRRLEADKRYLEEKLRQVEGKEPTNTHINEGMKKQPLPSGSEIRFSVGRGWVSVRITEDDLLQVMAGRSLHVQPASSNMLYLWDGDYCQR